MTFILPLAFWEGGGGKWNNEFLTLWHFFFNTYMFICIYFRSNEFLIFMTFFFSTSVHLHVCLYSFQCLQTFYFGVCVLNMLSGSDITARQNPRLCSGLQKFKDRLHACLAFPVGAVCIFLAHTLRKIVYFAVGMLIRWYRKICY